MAQRLRHEDLVKKGGSRFFLMSWTPQTPVGFDPCGVAMGCGRKAYSAPAKFYADDALVENRINWYRVPDGTLVYPHTHVFFPRSEFKWDHDFGGPFEQEGPGFATRAKHDGWDHYGFSGTHWHGTQADFLGLTPREVYHVNGVPPEPPCLGVPNLRFLFKLSLPRYFEKRPFDTLALGLRLRFGHLPFESLSLTLAVGNLKAAAVEHGGDLGQVLAVGNLPVGGGLSDNDQVLALAVGNLKAAALEHVGELGQVLAVGNLPVGGDLSDKDQDLALAVGNLKAAALEHVGDLGQVLAVGNLPVGGGLSEAALGLSVALEVVDGEDPEPDPGQTCDDAIALTIGMPYSVTIPSGETRWFTWTIPSFQSRFIRLLSVSGPISQAPVYTGPNCGSLTQQGSVGVSPHCQSFFSLSTQTFWLKLVAGESALSADVEAGDGNCPL